MMASIFTRNRPDPHIPLSSAEIEVQIAVSRAERAKENLEQTRELFDRVLADHHKRNFRGK